MTSDGQERKKPSERRKEGLHKKKRRDGNESTSLEPHNLSQKLIGKALGLEPGNLELRASIPSKDISLGHTRYVRSKFHLCDVEQPHEQEVGAPVHNLVK